MIYEIVEQPCDEEIKYVALANNWEIGTVILRNMSQIYPDCIVMTFLEVDRKHRGKGVARKLFQVAQSYARDRGRRLIPGPDLLWDEFNFWLNRDPQALAYVFTHRALRDVCEDEGGDLDHFDAQADAIRTHRRH